MITLEGAIAKSTILLPQYWKNLIFYRAPKFILKFVKINVMNVKYMTI